MKFQSKPKIIEAVQFEMIGGVVSPELQEFFDGSSYSLNFRGDLEFWCEQSHNRVTISPGDWVAKENEPLHGFYPIVKDAMEASYTVYKEKPTPKEGASPTTQES